MIKAANWSSYQSYKDRKPPWIRLHKTLLDNYEYQSMSADARALLPMLWLLASEDKDPTSGLVTDSLQKISFRLRIPEKTLKTSLGEIVKAGFFVEIQECNEPVTNPLQDRISTVTPETETETETEKRQTIVEQARRVISFLNEKTGKSFHAVPANMDLIKSRLKECATLDIDYTPEEQARIVIIHQYKLWEGWDDRDRFMRPATLFSKRNFWNYHGEVKWQKAVPVAEQP